MTTVDLLSQSSCDPVLVVEHSSSIETQPTFAVTNTSKLAPGSSQHSLHTEPTLVEDDRDGEESISSHNSSSGSSSSSHQEEDFCFSSPMHPDSTQTSYSDRTVGVRSILKAYSKEDLFLHEKKRCCSVLPKVCLSKVQVPCKQKLSRKGDESNSYIPSSFSTTVTAVESSEFIDSPASPKPTKNSITHKKKQVSFCDVQFRTFDQCIGDNPSVSYGTPISLDWNYVEHPPLSLDAYELSRPPRRKLRQLLLNYYHRRNRLMHHFGVSEEELKDAQKQADKVKRDRAMTRVFLPASFLEAAVESAKRKTRKLLR